MQARQCNMDYGEYLMFGKDQKNAGGPSPFGKLNIINPSFGDVFGISNDKNQVKSYLKPEETGLAYLLMKYRKQIKINYFNNF